MKFGRSVGKGMSPARPLTKPSLHMLSRTATTLLKSAIYFKSGWPTLSQRSFIRWRPGAVLAFLEWGWQGGYSFARGIPDWMGCPLSLVTVLHCPTLPITVLHCLTLLSLSHSVPCSLPLVLHYVILTIASSITSPHLLSLTVTVPHSPSHPALSQTTKYFIANFS